MAEYLKIKEVAERLEVSPKTARKYIRNGTIPSSFILGAYKVHRDDLERYLEEARVAPKDEAPPQPDVAEEEGPSHLHRPLDLKRYNADNVSELIKLKDELEAERQRLSRSYSRASFLNPTPEEAWAEARIRDAHIIVLENSLNVRDALDRIARKVEA